MGFSRDQLTNLVGKCSLNSYDGATAARVNSEFDKLQPKNQETVKQFTKAFDRVVKNIGIER